ncbi:hypothetical protein E2C01_094044 [Portunus trituberculatus]|uniref:Uncharacterized protein n=1 Tax=Portunus trituberculatus TaxID=210409 RepID=A0A5B7JVW1_PORTR|nr:hypothetical protein [Portunus trituberculatus]
MTLQLALLHKLPCNGSSEPEEGEKYGNKNSPSVGDAARAVLKYPQAGHFLPPSSLSDVCRIQAEVNCR